VKLAAVAVVAALILSTRGARADEAVSVAVEAQLDAALSIGGEAIGSFKLPDSIFNDRGFLGYALTDSSVYPSAGHFGFAPEEFQPSLFHQTTGRLGGIVAQPFLPQPPAGDVLRGVRNWDSPYGRKFLRGILIVTGTEIASGVVLALMPREFTNWDDTAYQRGSANLKRAWSEPPVWDGDNFFNNYLGHPYAGAFYYNMIRSQGGTVRQSFFYALFQSTLWEYVLEAVAEQPSIQDLVVTPIVGSLLGEVFHQLSLQIIRKGHLNFGQKVLVFFLNPSYVLNNGFRVPE